MGNYLKGEIKDIFNTLNETTKSYVEIKEELINIVEKARKNIKKKKIDDFLMKRKVGEKLSVYDMQLTVAAKHCFKNPKREKVIRYKIKIIEEIGEDIKEQLKYSMVLMEEEPNYDQQIEALTKLEEMKSKKGQEPSVLKTSVGKKTLKVNKNKTYKEMGARPREMRMKEG